MKVKNLFISFLLVFIVSFSVISLTACGSKDNTDEQATAVTDFTFVLNESKDGYIVKFYNGNEDIVTIPSKYNNLPVTEIGDYAFYRLNIYKVILPSSIKSIGRSSFYDCTNLLTINLENITNLGEGCFVNCSRIKEVLILDEDIYNSINSRASLGGLIGSASSLKIKIHKILINNNFNPYLEESGEFTKTENGDYCIFLIEK